MLQSMQRLVKYICRRCVCLRIEILQLFVLGKRSYTARESTRLEEDFWFWASPNLEVNQVGNSVRIEYPNVISAKQLAT